MMRAPLSTRRDGEAKKGRATKPSPKTPLYPMKGEEGRILREREAVDDPTGFVAVTV